MCGIVGYIGVNGGISRARMESMRDALAHRGPDGAGLRLFDERGQPPAVDSPAFCGLGHRRLSIVDLTEAGAQPMTNEDGSVWLTYNGEFYNFQEFRDKLESRGHVFRSHCDTETIVHLYEEYGVEKTLNLMNGMWGFGLYDGPRRRLILARDRVGKKPLYYAEVEGGLIFASEMKALYASGLIDRSDLDEEAIDDSLRVGTPLGPRTMFRQIRLLPPGHFAVWEGGRLDVRPYYIHPMERMEPENRSLDDLADELEALLVDAIKLRLIADVPVGLFLSGGIDSSLVAALTKKRLGRDVHAYCISFDEKDYDESAYAREVAAFLDVPFHIMPASASGPDMFDLIARHIDQPIGDASLVPTYLVSKAAREAGVKAILTGDGGDELFGGYDLYRAGCRYWSGDPAWLAGTGSVSLRDRVWNARMRRLGVSRGYVALQNQFSVRQRAMLFRSTRQAWSGAREADRRRRENLERVAHRPVLDRMQYSDMRSLMVDVVLRKVDLMSMANSIECRSPLLDYRVMEFSARLPLAAKLVTDKRGKVILRHLLARHVPERLFERPKRGFCMPWETTCTGAYAESLKRRWRAMKAPHLRPSAGDWIFEEAGIGGMYRKWAAFTQIVFFESIAQSIS